MSAENNSHLDLAAPGVRNRVIVIIAAGLMAMMLISVAVLAGIYVWQVPERNQPAPGQLPAPQVRTGERALRERLQAEQRAHLSGYRWEDAQKTVIGIPIERAMQIIAARGAHAYDPIAAASTSTSAPGPTAAGANQMPGVHVPSSKEPRRAQTGQSPQ